MTLNEIKKLPWFGISAVALQGLAFGLGFVSMVPGLQIALIMSLLAVGTLTIAVEHFKDKSKFKERDSHHLVGIMLTLSAAVLIAVLASSLVFGMSMIVVPAALGVALISALAVACRIEMRIKDNQYRKFFGDAEEDDDDKKDLSQPRVSDFRPQPTTSVEDYYSDSDSETRTLIDKKIARIAGM